MAPLQPQQFEQQRLDIEVPEKQPHQMGVMEFAQHPKTMFHGSDVQDFNELRDWENPDHIDQGFHFGTARAATDRLRQRNMRDRESFVHPLWHDEKFMQNTPETPFQDEGTDWTEASHHSYYLNETEHPGSVSGIVPSAHDVTTQGDFVREALERGGIPSGEAEYFHTEHRKSLFPPQHTEQVPVNRGIPRSAVGTYPTGDTDEVPYNDETGIQGSSERYQIDWPRPRQWGTPKADQGFLKTQAPHQLSPKVVPWETHGGQKMVSTISRRGGDSERWQKDNPV